MTTAYKCFTYDLSSPIQGGNPVWDGTLPYRLPIVEVDTSHVDCGAGWNACRDQHTALKIAHLWPDGWPIRLFRVKTRRKVIERADKVRAASWDIVEEIADLRPALLELSSPFGDLAQVMADEQLAWHSALARQNDDAQVVASGLAIALKHRGLDWTLRRFDSARSAWAARDAWDAWGARGAWAAWAAWDAWDAWGARDAWAAWAAWDARDAWDAWGARDAWAAWAALSVFFASQRGWTKQPADLLTLGIRDAYRSGLDLAIPTAPRELGWAMKEAGK